MQNGQMDLPLEKPTDTSFGRSRYLRWIDSFTHGHPCAKVMLEHLINDPRFKEIDGAALSTGTGGYRLQAEALSSWWLWRANATGIEQANRELNQFLDSDDTEILHVLWVYGVTSDKPIQLQNGICLMPGIEMPDSHEKEKFIEDTTFSQPGKPNPISALTKINRRPKLMSDRPNPKLAQASMKIERDLYNTAYLMNALPLVCCMPAFSTTYSPEGVPLGPFGGSGGGHQILDTIPYSQTRMRDDDTNILSELFNKFENFSPQMQERFIRALSRLAQAKGRVNAFDAALDLGISLEMLLLDEKNEAQEISLRFRLRGSWLLGKNEEERQELFKTLGKIYACRSEVAHSGTSKTLKNLELKEQSEMLEHHMMVASQIAQKLLLKDTLVPWDDLILGRS